MAIDEWPQSRGPAARSADDERHGAALAVAYGLKRGAIASEVEAREVLDMLGLLDEVPAGLPVPSFHETTYGGRSRTTR